MMKKLLILLLCMACVVAAAGCGNGGKDTQATDPANPAQTDTTGTDDTQTEPEGYLQVLDMDGSPLGQIDKSYLTTAADNGIFCSRFKLGEDEKTGTAEYRFFRASDKKDVLLGTLEDQSYEALYTRTELDGVVYATVTTGDLSDGEPDPLWLLAFDTVNETMQKYKLTDHGYPYTSMAAAQGKILIMSHELTEPRYDKIYAFDPANGTVTEVLSVNTSGETPDGMRAVCAAEDGFYLLRLKTDNENGNRLHLERYNGKNQKAEDRPLNELLIPLVTQATGLTDEADTVKELSMNVSGFAVLKDRYLFYENFTAVRLAVDLETGEALFARNGNYMMSIGGGEPLFYFYDLGQAEIYGLQPGIFGLVDGKFAEIPFAAATENEAIDGVSTSPAGSLAVCTKVNGAEEEKLYFRAP